uniref:RRM domain-containing protein n=2 Tax=Homalodisca liturata TaxID=320908 RepID=A0A1B6ITZ8_9HEMI
MSNKTVYTFLHLILNILYFIQFCFYECHGNQNSTNDKSEFIIKVQGLPWSTTSKDITAFFSECNINNETSGIHLIMTRDGRPSGVAYVEMTSEQDMELACKKDQEYMGNRFVEVFHVERREMERAIRRSNFSVIHTLNDGCVRLRGLPFKCLEEDIAYFFRGFEIVPYGITIVTDSNGRPTGDAFVQFSNKEFADKALKKDKKKLFHRYIEVFRSSLGEIRLAKKNQRSIMAALADYNEDYSNRVNHYRGHDDFGRQIRNPSNKHFGAGKPRFKSGRSNQMKNWQGINNRNRYTVYMRGLPFRANKSDIFNFFSPVSPTNIHIICNVNGKPTGEANVQFGSQDDAVKAMSKDKSFMYHRYVELFLN